jgi:hypothetical protein
MKTARWFGILSLSFCLWLLLFPPWTGLSPRLVNDDLGLHIVDAPLNLGHHYWRNPPPEHWQWSYADQKSSLVSYRQELIDYRLMLYEAAMGLGALALLFLLLPAIEMPTRIRNWRNQDLKRAVKGVTK